MSLSEETIFRFLLVTSILSVGVSFYHCSPDNCKLPECQCLSCDPPNGLNIAETPQFVLLSFDDAVTQNNFKFFTEIFSDGLKNPNDCLISATFYVSDELNTNYKLVETLFQDGNTISSHSSTHRFPQSWWITASETQLAAEFDGQRRVLALRGHIPYQKIMGMRIPFLQQGGNTPYRMAQSYRFKYDSSFVTGPNNHRGFLNYRPPWPFTLNHQPGRSVFPFICDIGPCPTESFPGLWEIPLVRMLGPNGQTCAMADGCKTTSATETYDFLMNNFQRHYNGNRAPFGINLHATWFERNPHALPALRRFLREMSTHKDVWVVGAEMLIDWARNPIPNRALSTHVPWKYARGCRRECDCK
ncbi:uncharacterized protein LOC112042631 [Lingula anatina]|uniref:Uncharacterized protein LOC112042631 n=1 Tax=Lingula anatina TaxID=7574 RepID=A0A2R2MSJ7_LINAN|nr:uncharacterized protein LOC112042631 [Lingula anatina]|eukprot:XP_023933236.1 uncharacterized protein LOC112042631 [Lingula anatina]